jgi:branched-chain amino acid transport system substrate-binding protein
MRSFLISLPSAILVAALLWAGPLAGPASAQEVVKVGLLAPLTGPNAADGEEFVRGVEWAVSEANAEGSVAGYTFETVVADVKDGSAANVSSGVERLLATDGVHVILTGYASLTLFEVELMAEAGMPYIAAGPSPSFSAITSGDPDKYWCCWSFTASFKGYETDVLPMVEGLAADGKIGLRNKRIAMVSSDNAYSDTIAKGIKESFAAAGWELVVDELVPFGEVSDWRVILARIRQADPAFVVNTDFIAGNSALFLRQFLESPTDSLVFLQYAPSVPEFVDLTGAQSQGVVYNLIGAPLDTPAWPRGERLMDEYEARYGVATGVYGLLLYEMANLYFEALSSVGNPADHEAIGNAIGKIKRDSVAGPIEFNPADHVAIQSDDHVPVTFWQIQEGGERVMFAPGKYANGEFRLPPWMSE